MPESAGQQRDQVEHSLAALADQNNCEPAVHYLRQAISSSRFLSSVEIPWNALTGSTRTLYNQVAIDANIVSVLGALADPALRLRVTRSKRGRPRTRIKDQAAKKNEEYRNDLEIYFAVTDRILERLRTARPNQTRGFRNLIGIKTIRDEVAKEFKIPESAVRKACARVKRRTERLERLKAMANPLNALMALRRQ